MKLRGAVALVTGGSEGIGKAIAKALKTEGCLVTITGRRKDVLEGARGDLGVDAIQGDVGREEDARRTVAEVVARHGRLDRGPLALHPLPRRRSGARALRPGSATWAVMSRR